MLAVPTAGQYTVIIPCHNKEGTIAEVLESVFKQTIQKMKMFWFLWLLGILSTTLAL